jgi:hypothetical protein
MLSIHLKNYVVILLVGIALGFFGSIFSKGCGATDSIQKEITVHPKELNKQAEISEQRYQEKIAELENNNTILENELITTKEQLHEVKKSAKQKENNIKRIIEPKGYPAKELLKKAGSLPMAIDNSLSPCDSLAEEVTHYINENAVKDSIYDRQLVIQDIIINIKDSILTLHLDKYNELKKIFTQSLIEQEKLLIDNNLLQKKIKRQKFRTKLIAIGATIFSGLAVDYLIHR